MGEFSRSGVALSQVKTRREGVFGLFKVRDTLNNDVHEFGYVGIVPVRREALLHLLHCRAKGFLGFGGWAQAHVISDVEDLPLEMFGTAMHTGKSF
jgi:hypothetical protein